MAIVENARPEWVRRLEAKHGLPIHRIPGTLYGLCYDPPIVVRSVSLDYAGDPPRHDERGYLSAGPIRHYVGWTQQRDPHRRIGNHHPAGTPVTVTLGRGTMEREEEIKRTAVCPTCGEPYRTSLTTATTASERRPLVSTADGIQALERVDAECMSNALPDVLDATTARAGKMAGDRSLSRSPLEFVRARAELDVWVEEITSVQGRDFADLDGFERYVLGVRQAAVWTMGERGTTPLLNQESPVTEDQILTELAVAEVLAKSRASGWEVATGVRNWLRWVIGEQPTVPYSVRDWD